MEDSRWKIGDSGRRREKLAVGRWRLAGGATEDRRSEIGHLRGRRKK
jgi:hypothetical protein